MNRRRASWRHNNAATGCLRRRRPGDDRDELGCGAVCRVPRTAGGTVKALSIREPWASKIACGRKTIETRTWQTRYRGQLLLCASRSPSGIYTGRAFAVAELVDVRPMTPRDESDACCEWSPDRYAWMLEDIVPVVDPWPVSGQLGLYDVDVGHCAVCGAVVRPGQYCCSNCTNGGV